MNHDNELILQTLLGPYGGWFRLSQSAVIGRAAEADVCLLHESIGREHARLMPLGQGWMIVDLGSPAGTSLNGVRLDPSTPTPIAAADLLRLGPWTFRVSFGSADTDPVAADHDAQPAISRAKAATPSATFRLRLLSTLLARLSQAAGEEQMAKIAVETALEGTGLARGAMLRPLESPDPARHDVSVVAAVGMADIGRRERALGREVLDAAWRSAQAGAAGMGAGVGGGTLRIARETDGHAKLVCAPVLLGQTLVSFLYLDAEKAATIQNDELDADATEFVEAVAAAYALALANLRRLELDRRQQALAAELHAARDAQRFILPPGEGSLGFLSYAMEMRPGLFVAGDLFDVVPLRDGRVVVCLGDVAGHGAGSAMLMATTQSYLHAQLLSGLPVDLAVTAANEFLCRKLGVGESETASVGGGGRFVSLWVGVFDKSGLLEYADAGHAHWFRISATGQPTLPETQPDDDDIPLGIGAGVTYTRHQLQLAPGDRVIVYSDGLIEQRGLGGEEFAAKGIISALAPASNPANSSPRRDVQLVLSALLKHAGTSKLADDATIACIRFEHNSG